MSKYTLNIDGFIGGYAFSKRLVRNFLADAGKNPVTVKISSLGGEINHALDIHNQFAEHGNITCEFSAFNASSATLIALGVRKSRIADNSFYLIHKALIWVDEWGNMNADDIESVIAKLDKQKNELETITLTLAKMYVEKTGKPLQQILDLMKKETWLTGEQAVELGFVDELFHPKGKTDPVKNESLHAFVNYSDLPDLPTIQDQDPIPGQTQEISDEGIINKLKSFTRKLINTQFKMKKFTALFKVLSVESLESNDEKGIFLNEEQLASINASLEKGSKAESDLVDANLAIEAFNGIDPSIAEAQTTEDKVQAIRDYMTQKPGKKAEGIQNDSDDNTSDDGVDWDTLMSLPHMQEDY